MTKSKKIYHSQVDVANINSSYYNTDPKECMSIYRLEKNMVDKYKRYKDTEKQVSKATFCNNVDISNFARMFEDYKIKEIKQNATFSKIQVEGTRCYVFLLKVQLTKDKQIIVFFN